MVDYNEIIKEWVVVSPKKEVAASLPARIRNEIAGTARTLEVKGANKNIMAALTRANYAATNAEANSALREVEALKSEADANALHAWSRRLSALELAKAQLQEIAKAETMAANFSSGAAQSSHLRDAELIRSQLEDLWDDEIYWCTSFLSRNPSDAAATRRHLEAVTALRQGRACSRERPISATAIPELPALRNKSASKAPSKDEPDSKMVDGGSFECKMNAAAVAANFAPSGYSASLWRSELESLKAQAKNSSIESTRGFQSQTDAEGARLEREAKAANEAASYASTAAQAAAWTRAQIKTTIAVAGAKNTGKHANEGALPPLVGGTPISLGLEGILSGLPPPIAI